MKKDKNLRILGIILEASFIGSIILYIYNYFIASKKYEVIPAAVKSRLNIFIIIAIVSFIAFLIIKYVLYLKSRVIVNNDEQLQIDFDDLDEEKIKDLEAPVTERVFIYKNEYEVPKERQAHCKNCGSIVDKNAYICLKCGYLLKNIVTEKVVEKVIKGLVESGIEVINLGLVICIIITVVLILNLAVERGIIK